MFIECSIITSIFTLILFCTGYYYYNDNSTSIIIKSLIFFLLSIPFAFIMSYLYKTLPPISVKKDKKKKHDASKHANKNVLNALKKNLQDAGHTFSSDFGESKDFVNSVYNFFAQENS
jgi:hypothetical protein